MIFSVRTILLSLILVELSQQTVKQIDVLAKLSTIRPDCQTKSFFKQEEQNQLFVDDLNKFCSSKSSSSDINFESKLVCRAIYSTLKKACSLTLEERFQIKNYDKKTSADKICSSKSVPSVNIWVLQSLGLNQTNDFQLNQENLCQKLSNNTEIVNLLRFLYKLSGSIVHLDVSLTSTITNNITKVTTTMFIGQQTTNVTSLTSQMVKTSSSSNSTVTNIRLNTSSVTVNSTSSAQLKSSQTTTIHSTDSTSTSVNQITNQVLDLSHNSTRTPTTTQPVNGKEETEKEDEQEQKEEEEEEEEEERPSNTDEREKTNEGSPADPADPDPQEKTVKSGDEEKVKKSEQEEMSDNSINQETNKSLDEDKQYQEENPDQINVDNQEEESPSELEKDVDANSQNIDETDREEDDQISMSKTTELDIDDGQGKEPVRDKEEREEIDHGHNHREELNKHRTSNVDSNNAPRVPKRKSSEDEGSSSNFLTYFLLLTLLFVVGYLILHNKNKLVGFIVEGRPRHKSTRENNRPSHRQYEALQNVNDVIDIDRLSLTNKS